MHTHLPYLKCITLSIFNLVNYHVPQFSYINLSTFHYLKHLEIPSIIIVTIIIM